VCPCLFVLWVSSYCDRHPNIQVLPNASTLLLRSTNPTSQKLLSPNHLSLKFPFSRNCSLSYTLRGLHSFLSKFLTQ
jgi:hypothetical protein